MDKETRLGILVLVIAIAAWRFARYMRFGLSRSSDSLIPAIAMLAACMTLHAHEAGPLERALPPQFTSCAFIQSSTAPYRRQSIYVPMPDGVRLAVDIFLPSNLSPQTRLPTLYAATRYWRAPQGGSLDSFEQQWLTRGYAVVNADVRGTGASFGQWYIPYSPQEAKDIGYLANWISRRPWSNGKVVMTGTSYLATTALMGPAYGAPAIKAVVSYFSDFDLYTDVIFPGGIAAEGLDVAWGNAVYKMDQGADQHGVRPVDGKEGQALLARAIRGHAHHSFADVVRDITFKDQRLERYGWLSMDDMGVYNLQGWIMRSGVPIFGLASWVDSGTAQGALSRFMTWSNPQLTVIGPWTHGAISEANVFNPKAPLDPPVQEANRMVFCFLNYYVGHPGNSVGPLSVHKKILIYFTMGEGKWHATYTWPVVGTRQRRLYFDANHGLTADRPSRRGEDVYRVDFNASTGSQNRWWTQAGAPHIDYGDRSADDARLLTYTSAPLRRDLEITGQPVITLRAASNRTDGNFIAYLEDVAADGTVTYLTEGELRAIDRRLSTKRPPYRTTYPYRSFDESDGEALIPGQFTSLVFQLQATSVLLHEGHRIRVAIAGADKGTFMREPAKGEAVIKISTGGPEPSFIEVPTVPSH